MCVYVCAHGEHTKWDASSLPVSFLPLLRVSGAKAASAVLERHDGGGRAQRRAGEKEGRAFLKKKRRKRLRKTLRVCESVSVCVCV